MNIALIIVSYNNRDQLASCLQAVHAGTHQPSQIVIVENGDMQSAEIAQVMLNTRSKREWSRLVHRPDNPGYAAAINAAIGVAPGADAYWILNPDTEPAALALTKMLEAMSKRNLDIVGGRIIDRQDVIQSDGGTWINYLARVVSINKGCPRTLIPETTEVERHLSFVSGASMLIRSSVLSKAGLFREDYFLYGEEVEWCVRAKKSGALLGYAYGAEVIHDQGSSTGYAESVRSRPKLPIYLDERNKILIVRDLDPWLLPISAFFSLALLSGRYIPARAWRQFVYAIHGWFDGLLGLRNKPKWFAR